MTVTAIPSPGTQVVVEWDDNPRGGVKSNRLGGNRTRKVILLGSTPNGVNPKPGQTWLCEVERITNQRSENRGAILVKPINLQIDLTFDDVWIDPLKAQIMAAVLQDKRTNLFLQGPQGVGKSTISRRVAEKLGWRFIKVEGSQIKKFTTMYGRYTPKPSHSGQFGLEWADSTLVAAVRTAIAHPDFEYCIMVDEYTRIDEDARDAFLGIIEGKERCLHLPKPEDILIPPNIHWMAAGNVGDEFTVKSQDAANIDRYVVVEITHMPLAEEMKHCSRLYQSCPRDSLEKGLTIIHKLRNIITTKMRLPSTISTRQAENMTMLLARGLGLEDSLMTTVANQFRGRASDPSSDRARVGAKIASAIKGNDIEKE